jgi:hypothetical protein
MTNDGDMANRLMHPSHNVKKTYHTWVRGRDIKQAAEKLAAPMEIDGYTTRPAHVDVMAEDEGGAHAVSDDRRGQKPSGKEDVRAGGTVCDAAEKGPGGLSGAWGAQARLLALSDRRRTAEIVQILRHFTKYIAIFTDKILLVCRILFCKLQNTYCI